MQEKRRYPRQSELWGWLVRASGRYFLEGLVAAGTVFAGPSDYLATHDRG